METLKNIPINIKEIKPHLILSVPALAKNFKKNIEQGIQAKGDKVSRPQPTATPEQLPHPDVAVHPPHPSFFSGLPFEHDRFLCALFTCTPRCQVLFYLLCQ